MKKIPILSLMIIVMFNLFITTALHAAKSFIKSKELKYIEATEDTSVLYLMHYQLEKKDQYIAVDGENVMILPHKTYAVLAVEPGWHLITIMHKKMANSLTYSESYKIFCYPGETQVLNIMNLSYVEQEEGSLLKRLIKRNCHSFVIDRYPAKELRAVLKKHKLKYVTTTEKGLAIALKALDRTISRRNNKKAKTNPDYKLTLKEAAQSYPLPTEPPVWNPEGWDFKLKAAYKDVSKLKLGLRKYSQVHIGRKGVDIKSEKYPEMNIFVPFENIIGFERVRMMKRLTPPFYLNMNFTHEGVEKQILFFTGDSNPYGFEGCRVHPVYKTKKDSEYNLTVHDTDVAGYEKLESLTDVIFWFEREKDK
jgi:hypothetical protein